MRNLFISLILLYCNSALMAQYPDVTIREIQEVPPGQDSSLYAGDTVHTGGIVTVGTSVYMNPENTFYLAMSNGGPFSGIYVYNPYEILSLVPGDSVSVDAVVTEFGPPDHPPIYGYHTALGIVPGSYILHASGLPIPEPMIISAESIDSTGGADSLAEQYEGCYVRINDVTVDSVVFYSYTTRWLCHDTTGHSFWVREHSDSINFNPSIGDRYSFLQGVIYPLLGNYHVKPTYMRDIGFMDGPVITNAGHWPDNPTSNDTIIIGCNVTDNGEVVGVDLNYRVHLGSWIEVSMLEGDNDEYSYSLAPFPPLTRIDYSIEAEDDEGIITYWPINNYITIIIDFPSEICESGVLPAAPALYQNYPNPFNARTTITYSIGKSTHVIIEVYDILGKKVSTVENSYRRPGISKIEFDASGLPSGLYFYSLRAAGLKESKKMFLLK